MAVNRASVVDANFIDFVNHLQTLPHTPSEHPDTKEVYGLEGWEIVDIFHTMMQSRHLDFRARELKKTDRSFYTIGSSGHEGNACVAKAMRHTDPAFLHYRSGAFYLQRAKQVDSVSGVFDVLKGIVASTEEPIAGGRHKVFGSVPLNIPPQTSTIASHLPKAVGAAFTIARKNRLQQQQQTDQSIVVCTFGDASSNHSTACGAFNAASLTDYQNLPCPVLFVCEDNGIGISVRTPKNWIEQRFAPNPGLKYFSANGLDILECHQVAKEAVEYVRRTRRPTFLHIKLVRLLGHAGSDVERLYRSQEEIERLEATDPLLKTAHTVYRLGLMNTEDILAMYEATRQEVLALAKEAVRHQQIPTAEDVVSVLAPRDDEQIQIEACTPPPTKHRARFHNDRLPEQERPRHLAMLLNRALGDMLCKYDEMMIFGEDVGQKGGVYHVTADLQSKAGVGRVFNTPLDETAILGVAIGAGQMGMLPVPEIQYLAYLHNAIDQLRGEACSLQFFSQGQFQNPMVVRIAAYAYQKGFGGHFHNANSVAAIRDIPGLIIASPSNGHDATLMLRTCMAAAKVNGLVSVFLEPIALYMTKDLHQDKDGLWLASYPSFDDHIAIGEGKVCREGGDITIITYANGLWMSLRAAERLKAQGIECTVVDIRWLNPLPESLIVETALQTKRVLIVDECRKTGGMAEPIMALLAERTHGIDIQRVTGWDTYIPLGDAANLVLVQEKDIEAKIIQMVKGEKV